MAYKAGDYAGAANFYSQAIDKDPSNAALFRYKCTHNYGRCPRTAKHVPYTLPQDLVTTVSPLALPLAATAACQICCLASMQRP